MMLATEPLSTAEKIDHTLLGLGAALSGGWLAPTLIDALTDAEVFGDPDLVIALTILFIAFGLVA
ncbi:MAG TPA: hypothetical protein ENJ18_15555, partial [Nannocystis exedens]|nr:hypothetical protein [Nannocystis exedens]